MYNIHPMENTKKSKKKKPPGASIVNVLVDERRGWSFALYLTTCKYLDTSRAYRVRLAYLVTYMETYMTARCVAQESGTYGE